MGEPVFQEKGKLLVVPSDAFPNQLTVLSINKFVENLNKYDICIGNNDNVVKNKLEKNADLVFSDKNNEEKAALETIDMENIGQLPQ